ncbi:glycosyltransferase family 4 protein [Microbacterium sp. P5_E9]
MSGAPGRVHFLVPTGIDDPDRVSGGNIFDRHIRDGLAGTGWDVQLTEVETDAAPEADAVLSGLPDGALVLIDGLVATGSPEAVESAAGRLRIVVLAHMVSAAFPDADPQGIDRERRALRAAHRVIATSEWTKRELVRRGLAPADRIDVATPGADAAVFSPGTPSGRALLCVGVVAPHKGQDTLVEALAALAAQPEWTCTIAGSLDARPDFAERITARANEAGVAHRITMAGVLGRDDLDAAYRRADLLVAPSRAESYGMAIGEALRRGIPIVASSVGGVPQTVSPAAAVLVPPDQPAALRQALEYWMIDPGLRSRMKAGAQRAGARLPQWSDTVARIGASLEEAR